MILITTREGGEGTSFPLSTLQHCMIYRSSRQKHDKMWQIQREREGEGREDSEEERDKTHVWTQWKPHKKGWPVDPHTTPISPLFLHWYKNNRKNK